MENKGIYVLENFLSEKECDEILNIVKNMYKKRPLQIQVYDR